MGFLQRLFGKESKTVSTAPSTPIEAQQSENSSNNWVNIDKFIPSTDQAKNKIISVIATAIAAGDNRSSQFTVKHIQQLNPEFKLVALIATSIAAGDAAENKFVVKSVQRKID